MESNNVRRVSRARSRGSNVDQLWVDPGHCRDGVGHPDVEWLARSGRAAGRRLSVFCVGDGDGEGGGRMVSTD